MTKIKLKYCLLVLAVGINSLLHAQANMGKYVFNQNVNAMVKTTDGSTYVGGSFQTVGLYSGNGVSLEANTGAWDDTDVKVEGIIRCVVAIPFGLGAGWYIGGDFTSINGQSRNRLARINADGTLHNFNPNMNNPVYALALDARGNLYAGGEFTSAGDSIRNRLAKFDNSGVLTSFNPNLSSQVSALVVDSSRNIYVGGQFVTIGDSTRRFLAKFDSTGILTNFNPNMNSSVLAITLDASENLYAGGHFTAVGGSTRNRLAKFDNTGVLTSFNPIMNNFVSALALDESGNLYAGGRFTLVSGITRNRIAKFDSSGVLANFNPNINGGGLTVHALTTDMSGNLYMGGSFNVVDGSTTISNLVKFDSAGVLTSFNPDLKNGFSGTYIYALAIDANGSLYVGGQFITIGELIPRNNLAKFDSEGVLTNFNPNLNAVVRTLAIDSSGNLYVGGAFTTVGDSARNRLAKFDNLGVLTSFNSAINGPVRVLALDTSGNIYVGGDFTAVGGSTRNRLAKFDNTGVLLSFNPNMNNSVLALAIDASGNLYVGGGFTTVGGAITRNRIAKFDIAGVLTNFNPNINSNVVSLALDVNGNIYMGGAFTTVDDSTRNRIAKFDTAGALTSFSPKINSTVYSIAFNADGDIYVGGHFTTIGDSTTRNRIAKFNTAGVLSSFDPNMDNQVFVILIDANGNLYLGGKFTTKYAYFCLTPPIVTSTTPSAICEAGTVNLNATASFGSTIRWYADSIGGSSLYTGATYTTPSISATTTYYVEADNGGCISDVRTAIAATINYPTNGTDIQIACDSFTWIDGNTYTTNNNTATFNIVGGAASGCDSLVSLDLTINNSTYGTDIQIACDSFAWIDGNTYTTNNKTATFNIVGGAASGCDSLVSLDLTINNSTYGTDIQIACDSFAWIDGNTYTTNNKTATFNIVGGAASGCDSLVSLDLTINNSTYGTDIQIACGSFTWIDGNTYIANNNTATFNIIGGSASGCDSLVSLDLIINTVDHSITDNSPTIISNAIGATYQWLDCTNGNLPISGETNQSFTATVNGDYAVEVNLNSCIDTSICVTVNNVGIEVLHPNIYSLRIYPNPSHGVFTLEYNYEKPVKIEVLTIQGKLIIKSDLTNNSNEINLSNQPAGIYFIYMSFSDSQKIIRKVIVN